MSNSKSNGRTGKAFSIDTTAFDEALQRLTHDELVAMIDKALRKWGKAIADQTKENLKTRVGGVVMPDMLKGVRHSPDKYDKTTHKVHVMGFWANRIMELGSTVGANKERESKGYHRITRFSQYGSEPKTNREYGAGKKHGKLNPLYFFKDALVSKNQVGIDLATEELFKLINKAFNGK